MHLVFLIPLSTSLVAGYLFKKSADEMAYLTGALAIFSLVLSLILAPWQLQLLILMLVAISTRRLLLQNEYRVKLEEQEPLQLSDVNNEGSTPPIAITEGEIAGKYRGNPLKAGNLEKVTVLQPTFDLKYRGNSITYQKLPTPQDSE